MKTLPDTLFRRSTPLLLVVVLCSGCLATRQTADEPTRLATDTPDHFLVGSHTGTDTTEPKPGDGCRNPMVDARDGSKLTLVRSTDKEGDYAVPKGRYGAGPRELLRLDCSTGEAIGFVRR